MQTVAATATQTARQPTAPRASQPATYAQDVDDTWRAPQAPALPPLARVAALLVAISQNNSYEGRNPQTMPDGLTSGFVADLLGVEIGTLAAMLVDLRRRGLIDIEEASGLRLKDIAGLERLTH
jgi:hypothetical protein